MTRLLTGLLALGCASTAHAGGYLAGSLHGSPAPATSITVGAPMVRLGFGNGSFAAFGSLAAARLHIESNPDLNLAGLQPMFGVRGRVGKNPAEAVVNPILSAGTYTRVFFVTSPDEDFEPPEQDVDAGLRPVIGAMVGTGLDARLSPNLSLSAEIGLDVFSAGYRYDNWVQQGSSLSTWSAVTVNIWL